MKHIVSVCTLLLLCVCMQAQSAGMMTQLLAAEKVTYAQASYFPAVWLDAANENLSPEQAARYLAEQGILSETLGSGDISRPVTLQDYALICMRAWNISGGMMYTFTGLPHYAFRELQARGILFNTDDPHSFVSGQRAVNILYTCMEAAGEGAD